MKCTVTVLCILAIASLVSSRKDMFRALRECKEKTGCNENIMQIMRNHGEPETDECYCAMGCFGKEKGMFTEENGVEKETLIKILERIHIPDDNIESIAENCKTVSATDECEAARALLECMKSQQK